jgi:hypothetical protein
MTDGNPMSFFRTATVAAEDVARSPALLTQLRARALDGVIVTDVYDRATCAAVCDDLAHNRHGLVRTDFPAKFAAFFYGINLNLAHPDLTDYFDEAPRFAAGLRQLFPEGFDLRTRVSHLLSALDGGRVYAPPPGPRPGSEYMFTTLRAHLTGGYIPPHFDDEQAARPSYRQLMPLIQSSLFSFVLAFSQSEGGGALEIFNLQPETQGGRIAVDGRSSPKPDLDGVERVSFRLAPGEMIIVNSGRCLHRVTPVVGATVRWTACSFMAQASSGDRVYCWG